MQLSLDPDVLKIISDRIRSGRYASPEAVVTAALCALEHDEHAGEFLAGEWDALLEEGESSGEALDGDSVLGELRQLRGTNRPG